METSVVKATVPKVDATPNTIIKTSNNALLCFFNLKPPEITGRGAGSLWATGPCRGNGRKISSIKGAFFAESAHICGLQVIIAYFEEKATEPARLAYIQRLIFYEQSA